MKTFRTILTLLTIGLTVSFAIDQPIQYKDLELAGFKPFKRLKDDERAAFFEAYPMDKEMINRVMLGTITKNPMTVCIAGEAPSIAEARERSPHYYPQTGRMLNIEGTFEWQGKGLFFRTKQQLYEVEEHHITYRLEQMGLQPKSAPRKATVDAVWTVNSIDGLRFVYMQKVKLH